MPYDASAPPAITGNAQDTHSTTPLLAPEVDVSRSPEETGRYECAACGEREAFVGADHRGADGPDACDCDGPVESGGHAGDCAVFADVVLTQTFRVIEQDGTPEGAALDYDAFEGGECGAEIGRYTRIACAQCRAVVWQDPTTHR